VNGVHLNDVLDPTELKEAIDAGYVRQQTHPSEPLTILNYTEKAS
jgi:RNA ligase